MNPRRKKRLFIISSSIIFLTAAVGLMLYALQQNIDLFYTPSEIIQGKELAGGKRGQKPTVGEKLKVGGMVVEGSVERSTQDLNVSFRLTDIGPEVTVKYNGILPDLFREGQGIVAEGVLVAPTIIEATIVLAKHDEEYMPPELAEKMKGIKHVKPEY
jgi:cytochrome c-type biogenesis protein CcmE